MYIAKKVKGDIRDEWARLVSYTKSRVIKDPIVREDSGPTLQSKIKKTEPTYHKILTLKLGSNVDEIETPETN